MWQVYKAYTNNSRSKIRTIELDGKRIKLQIVSGTSL